MAHVFSRLHHSLAALRTRRPGVGLLFAAALIPGILAGVLLSYGIYHNQREQLEQGALQTARALIRAVDSELLNVETTAQALSTSELLTTKNFAGFHRNAQDVLRMTGVGSNYVLSDLSGQQLLNTSRPRPCKNVNFSGAIVSML